MKHYPEPKYWNDLLNNQLFASKTDRELRSLYRLMEDTKVAGQGRGIRRDGDRPGRGRVPERSQAHPREGDVRRPARPAMQVARRTGPGACPARAPLRTARSCPARTRRSRRRRPATTWWRSASSSSARATMPRPPMPSRRASPRAVSATSTTPTRCSASRWHARAIRRMRCRPSRRSRTRGWPSSGGSGRSLFRRPPPQATGDGCSARAAAAGRLSADVTRQLACRTQTRAISASLGSLTWVKALLASLLRLVRVSAIPSSMFASSASLTPPLASALRSASTAFG